jgi:hypothetical protein
VNDDATSEPPVEDPGGPELPPVQPAPWNASPWATPTEPSAAGPAETQVVAAEEQPPARKRRWLRRTLVSLVVLLVVAGLVGGSLAYVDHRREVRHKKEVAARLAAEKKAAAAFLTAVKPLVVRVFDAVQPIQDVYDSGGHRRKGYEAARDDVIQHGGALRELKAVKLAIARLKAPVTYAEQADRMANHLDALIAAVTALEKSSHEKGNASGIITSYGPNFQNLESEELLWSSVVGNLDKAGTWPLPSEDRKLAHGRKAPTTGGFISGSDFACGRAYAALEFEDFKNPDKFIRSTYPKITKEFRALTTRLKAVPYPTRQRPLRHRLELGWTSLSDVATQMGAVSAAFKRRDVTAFERSFARLKEALDGMNDLALAYKSVGAEECYRLLVVDDGKKGSSSTTA